MMPETTSMPWAFRVSMPSRIGTIMLCDFDIAFSASGSGVSMPQKTVSKPASRIMASRSRARAMFRVASQAKEMA